MEMVDAPGARGAGDAGAGAAVQCSAVWCGVAFQRLMRENYVRQVLALIAALIITRLTPDCARLRDRSHSTAVRRGHGHAIR